MNYLSGRGLLHFKGDGLVNEQWAKRKSTAILSAINVKGYSRLMEEDEVSTVETLKSYREVISSFVGQSSGRWGTPQVTISWLSLPVSWTE